MAMDQMNNHESFRAGFGYVTKAGEIPWVEIHTRLLEDAEGEVSGLFGSINDITERKHIPMLLCWRIVRIMVFSIACRSPVGPRYRVKF